MISAASAVLCASVGKGAGGGGSPSRAGVVMLEIPLQRIGNGHWALVRTKDVGSGSVGESEPSSPASLPSYLTPT